MVKTTTQTAIMLACGVMLAPAANAVVIDEFTVPQEVDTDPDSSNPSASAIANGPTILGSERDIALSSTGDGDLSVQVDAADSDQLRFSLDADTTGSALITWDGDDDDATSLDPAGLGSIDLTNGGINTGIGYVVSFADLGLEIVTTIYSGAGDFSSTSNFTAQGPIGIGSIPAKTFFQDFEEDFVGNADFTDVSAVTMELIGEQALDFELDLLLATDNEVPAPAAGALALAGIGGLAGLRRLRAR